MRFDLDKIVAVFLLLHALCGGTHAGTPEMTDFEKSMNAIADAFETGDYKNAVILAKRGKSNLLERPSYGPVEMGWYHLYEFKSWYALKRYREAYPLADLKQVAGALPPGLGLLLSDGTMSWIYSVGVELAGRLGKVEKVLEFGEECCQMRLRMYEKTAACDACQMVCLTLAIIRHDELNTVFARRLIDLGQLLKNKSAFLYGYAFLRKNSLRSHNGELGKQLAKLQKLGREYYSDFDQEANFVFNLFQKLSWQIFDEENKWQKHQ